MKKPSPRFQKKDRVTGTSYKGDLAFDGIIKESFWHITRSFWQYLVQDARGATMRVFEEKQLKRR